MNAWFVANARDLPWRRAECGPWGVLVSEFMLQQTPVARVIPLLDAWLERWPTPSSLAGDAPAEAVRAWANLGYPRRALWLHRAIAEAPHLREPYLEFADLLYQQKDWCGVIFMVNCALAITERPRTYICEPFAWGSFPYDLLSIAYFHLSQWENALKNAEKAFALAPDDARLQENCALLRAKIQKESRI